MTAAQEDTDADSAGDHHVLNDIKAGTNPYHTQLNKYPLNHFWAILKPIYYFLA